MNPTTAIRLAIGFALFLAVAIFLSQCTSLFTGAKEAKVAKGQAEASIQSGAEAMNTVSNVSAADDRVDATVKGGSDEIRSQPAGHSNDAAVRAACRMHSHIGDERCTALRRADSGNADGAR